MTEEACFAYKNGKCKALKVKRCTGEGCGFFKTAAQLAEEQQKVLEHIRSLDKETKEHIIHLYYGGKMSVLEEGS